MASESSGTWPAPPDSYVHVAAGVSPCRGKRKAEFDIQKVTCPVCLAALSGRKSVPLEEATEIARRLQKTERKAERLRAHLVALNGPHDPPR